MFRYVSPEQRVPQDHPLRPVREMVDTILQEMSGRFARLYSERGRPSIAPERLLRALRLQLFYSVRSERLLHEEIAQAFFQRVLRQATPYRSDEHVPVDGPLLEAWASPKSFRPDGGARRGPAEGLENHGEEAPYAARNAGRRQELRHGRLRLDPARDADHAARGAEPHAAVQRDG